MAESEPLHYTVPQGEETEPLPVSDSVTANASTSEEQTSSRPTHSIQNMKVGARGVQLLVSTQDHLYNAKDIEGGDQAWQCVGSWTESTVQDLIQRLPPRQSATERHNQTPNATRMQKNNCGVGFAKEKADGVHDGKFS